MPDLEHVKVGPDPKGLTLKIIPADGPSRALVSGARANARLHFARMVHGTQYDALIRDNLHLFDEALRRPWSAAREDFLGIVKTAGLTVQYDKAATEALNISMARLNARYSRTLPIPQADDSILWEKVPTSIATGDLQRASEILTHLGWDQMLFPFAREGVIEMATKRDVLIAVGMGGGKTRMSLALTEVHRYQDDIQGPTLIIALRKHLLSWREEFQKIPLLRAMYGDKPYEELIDKKDQPTFTKPFILVSLDRLKRLSEDELAEVRRVAATGQIIVDEIYVASNANSAQSRVLTSLSALHHVGLSGSPVRGYPDSAFIPFCWTLRGGSSALPDYPLDRAGSQKRWNAKFVTFANSGDGSRKKVPFLKNEAEFYAMIEPLMYRRLRNEPDLIRDIGSLILEEETLAVELDPQHQAFYLAVLKRFQDWYVREIQRRRNAGEKAAIPPNEILVKLGYLVRGVSAPWRMKDPLTAAGNDDEPLDWPEYPRQPTAIHRAATERAAEEVAEGYQVIIFADNRDGLEVMREDLLARGVTCAVIHGEVAHARREEIVHELRRGDISVLLASYGTVAEGWNLAAASRVIITEYNWSPSTIKQAVARITRPDQRYTPKAIYLTAPGTIQEYVRRLCMLKQESMDAALDRVKQTSSGEDVPDISTYARSIVNRPDLDAEQVEPRVYELELEEDMPTLLTP